MHAVRACSTRMTNKGNEQNGPIVPVDKDAVRLGRLPKTNL
jgi:hypothetical protein